MKIAPAVLSIVGGMVIGYVYHDKVVSNITVSAPSGDTLCGGGGEMGGGRPTPEHPFTSERNKKALEDLTTTLQKNR